MTKKQIAEMIETGQLYYHVVAMPPRLWGFVIAYENRPAHIFLSQSIPPEVRSKVFLHECHHTLVDLPAMPEGFIGADMRCYPVELEAEDVALSFFKKSS